MAVVAFLIDIVRQMNKGAKAALTHRVFNISSSAPLLIVSKMGTLDESILLNSHMDVVYAANSKDWLCPPFSGHYDESTDRIYGRGSQDMKSQAIQYLAALQNLLATHDGTVLCTFLSSLTRRLAAQVWPNL